METENKPKDETLFNAGIDKLMIIGDLRRLRHSSFMAHDWSGVFDILISIRTEINSKMDETQRTKTNEYQVKINKEVEIYKKGGNTFDTSNLLDYEFYLMDIIETIGMGMPKKPKRGGFKA